MESLAEKIKELFIKKFKNTPSVYFSPGRINLIGEHIDYNDGFVMPCAINKGMYFAIAENGTDTIHFYSRDYDEKYETPLNKIGADEGWKNYVLGVVDEFQKAGKEIKGFDCVFGANLPSGAGLSSSAALEGGLAFGLNETFNLGYTRKELAFLCQRAEHGFPGVKCGIMDQYANMMGEENHAIYLDCMSFEGVPIPLELGDYSIVLINSRVHHALASSAYNTRRNESETGLQIIRKNSNYKSYRDIKSAASLKKFEIEMGTYVFKRATFIVEEIQRTILASKLLKQKKIKAFGELMFQSHEGQSNLYKVSCAELDFLVKIAKSNPDVVGARMMGGGFGGCTINLVKSSGIAAFIENSLTEYKKEFQISAEPLRVTVSNGTMRLG
ncbi:MAG: galactokinase [Chitinophagaceae bacterium]|nr:galactokinase [Chitinophagaceae bacterium]